jgi:hypothetical protein
MNRISWIGLVVALLGGGAMGALIKVWYDLRQGRIQPIAKRVQVFPLFRQYKKYQDFDAVLSVAHNGKTTEYRTLFVADVAVRNRSNRDFAEFEFGVTLEPNSQCVHVGWENPDQHHKLNSLDGVSPSDPRSELRFHLRPFNRRDSYSLRLYLVPKEPEGKPAIAKLTSPHPVNFIEDSVSTDTLPFRLHLLTLLLAALLSILLSKILLFLLR